MDSANDFFNNLKGSLSEQTNSAMVCKVERFDATKMKADVLPLINNSDGTKPSMLIEVPVMLVKAGGFAIRPPYKKGDIVLVVFIDRDMDNFLRTGDTSTPETSREHSLDDAVVVGSVMPFTEELPSEGANDLVIGTEDFSSTVIIRPNGDIVIKAGEVYLGSDAAVEGVPLGDSLKEWLDNHTHEYDWTSTGGSNTSKKPTTRSPKPSDVVKII